MDAAITTSQRDDILLVDSAGDEPCGRPPELTGYDLLAFAYIGSRRAAAG